MKNWKKYWDVSKGVEINENYPIYVFDSNHQMMLDVDFDNFKSSLKFEIDFFRALKKILEGQESGFFKDNFDCLDLDGDDLIFCSNKGYVILASRGYGFLQYRCESEEEIIDIQLSLISDIADATKLNFKD